MDEHLAELRFSFAGYSDQFDEHIRRSIRGYADLLSDCRALSEYFVENDTSVLDIGCSTGSFLFDVWNNNRERCPNANYVGIDIEPSFSAHWQNKNVGNLTFQTADVRTFEMPPRCSFVTSIFSLQFISERERHPIVADIHRALIPGGALIIAEKTHSNLSKLDGMLSSIHYDFKRNSFTAAEILAKARSLRSTMKLWSESQIVDSLVQAGFHPLSVQSFWRNHNFAAFIAIR
jgi:tRNA (cmo5U34)-methyltransferase